MSEMFPNAKAGEVTPTSDPSGAYNCIAWALWDMKHWIWPDPKGVYSWPPALPRTPDLGTFFKFFELAGFEAAQAPSNDWVLYEYVAIFMDGDEVAHAARQLPDGSWASKLGEGIDVEHAAATSVENKANGVVRHYVRRRRAFPPPPVPALHPPPPALIDPYGYPLGKKN